MIIKILILLVLIFINGIFSSSEMAYLNLSKYELKIDEAFDLVDSISKLKRV